MRLLGKALTFDDVLLVPAYSQVLPRDTSLRTHLSRNIVLNLPVVSAAMDTVTEARLAIAIAQEGGIGVIHKNLSPMHQAAEVARVKRYESGLLRDPVTIAPGARGAPVDRPIFGRGSGPFQCSARPAPPRRAGRAVSPMSCTPAHEGLRGSV